MARSGTGVASPCADGSTMFFNPAGLVNTPRQISIGGTLIKPAATFTNSATGLQSSVSDKIYPVPNLYLNQPFAEGRYAAGIGVFAPYGLETNWPTDAQGRFLGYKSVVQGIYIQPTVAAKIGTRVRVGLGFDISYVRLQLRQRVDLSQQFVPAPAPPGTRFENLGIARGTDFADVDLEGHSTGVGYHLGVLVTVTDRIELGARYLSRQKITIDNGDVKIAQVSTGITLPAANPFNVPAGTPLDAVVASQFSASGPLTDQSGSTGIRFPEQLVLGAAVRPTERVKLLFDFQYTNWAVFDALNIEFEKLGTKVLQEKYKKTYGYRFGGEYSLSPVTTARAGFYTHGAAAPDETVTPNLPEAARTSFTLGFGTKLGRGLVVDLAYQYVDQADRQGRSGDGGLAEPTTAQNDGLYAAHVHLFGATFSYAF